MRKIDKVVQYLSGLNSFSHLDIVKISVLARLAQIGITNRIMVRSSAMVKNGDFTSPASLYLVTYAQSGGGKDRPIQDLKRVTSFFEKDFVERSIEYVKKREGLLRIEAGLQGLMSEKEVIKYMKENEARTLSPEIAGGTTEGFIADREEFVKAKFGGVFVRISEFADYITNDNPVRQSFLSSLVESYDHGQTIANSLKGTKHKASVENIPSSCYVYTSPAGILEGKHSEKLKTFNRRGFARRSITCFPKLNREEITNPQDRIIADRERADAARTLERDVGGDFEEYYKNTKYTSVFTLSQQAEQRLVEYKIECYNASLNYSEDAICSEIEGRDWKAFKLSGFIAAFEHPLSAIVELEDIEDAIAICEKYGEHFVRFCNARDESDIEKLTQYLLNQKNTWITKGDIREQNFVYKDKFGTWFEEIFPDAIYRLDEMGYVVEYATHGKSDRKYRVILKEEITQKVAITISQSRTNQENDTGFFKKEIVFEEMPSVLKSPLGWSPTFFKSNYRKKENAVLNFRIFAYDIDSGMTLQEAKELLEIQKIRAIIATTRNHRKEKNGLIADRFRVVIPLTYEWIPESTDQYRRGLRHMAEKIGLPIDRAATDASRFFYGNPAAVLVNIEGSPVDMSIYQEEPEVRKSVTGSMDERRTVQSDSGIQRWFADHTAHYGGRNAMLFQVAAFYINKKKLDRKSAHLKVLEVNALLSMPLPIQEIERTIFKTTALDKIQTFN